MFLFKLGKVICMSMGAVMFIPLLLGEGKVLDKIVARVGDEIITQQDLEGQICQFSYQSQDEEKIRTFCLNHLIEQALLLQDFNARKGNVVTSQLDNQMNAIVQDNFQGDYRAFMSYLIDKEQSFVGFRNDLKRSIIIHAMRQQTLKSSFHISPQAVIDYYRAHLDAFTQLASILLEQKCFKADSMLSDGEIKKIDYYHKGLQEGKSVAALADALDEFNLPHMWYTMSELAPCLAEKAFSLPGGGYSEIIEHNNLYFILHVLDKRNTYVKPLVEVQPMIEACLLKEMNEQAFQQWIQVLKSKTPIEM
ncbi:MAG: peptidyl-prolyl cis-trans isomerase [Puniceicoccales bacterium]|jgi:parvulin-like peptidyl-prolyl isomerase|nr:peptidyl-prolyl cis-trans isomerase [Puniceicoccales bacterium]